MDASWMLLLEKIPFINTVLTLIVIYVLREVQTEVHITNGRLTRLEQWQIDHEKFDTERFKILIDRKEKA